MCFCKKQLHILHYMSYTNFTLLYILYYLTAFYFQTHNRQRRYAIFYYIFQHRFTNIPNQTFTKKSTLINNKIKAQKQTYLTIRQRLKKSQNAFSIKFIYGNPNVQLNIFSQKRIFFENLLDFFSIV